MEVRDFQRFADSWHVDSVWYSSKKIFVLCSLVTTSEYFQLFLYSTALINKKMPPPLSYRRNWGMAQLGLTTHYNNKISFGTLLPLDQWLWFCLWNDKEGAAGHVGRKNCRKSLKYGISKVNLTLAFQTSVWFCHFSWGDKWPPQLNLNIAIPQECAISFQAFAWASSNLFETVCKSGIFD